MGTATLVRDEDVQIQERSAPLPRTVQAAEWPPVRIEAPAERNWEGSERQGPAVRVKAALRRQCYERWRRLPEWMQHLALRLGAAKVTYGACAVIQDSRGHVLLAHHTYRQRAWGLPGGLIGRDEQPFEAVERELREELGVRAMVGPVFYAETYLPTGHMTLYYRATIAGTPRADGVEIDGFRYASPDEAAALLGPEAHAWLARLYTRRAS